MRLLVDKTFGDGARLEVSLLDYPLREVRVSLQQKTIYPQDLIDIANILISVSDFMLNDPNPWENDYGQI